MSPHIAHLKRYGMGSDDSLMAAYRAALVLAETAKSDCDMAKCEHWLAVAARLNPHPEVEEVPPLALAVG